MFGHELAHTKGPTFVLARWMMALSGISHFCYAHVYNHHLELGCEDDPATSPRGRSIYSNTTCYLILDNHDFCTSWNNNV